MDKLHQIERATAQVKTWEGRRREEIFEALIAGIPQVDIAKAAGITQSRVSAIAKILKHTRPRGRPRRGIEG